MSEKNIPIESGICPKCGAELADYNSIDFHDLGGSRDWACSNCGAEGEEHYDEVFTGHRLPDGKFGKFLTPTPVRYTYYLVDDNGDCVGEFESSDDSLCLDPGNTGMLLYNEEDYKKLQDGTLDQDEED